VRGVEFLQSKLNTMIDNYFNENKLSDVLVIEMSKNFWNSNLNNKLFYSNSVISGLNIFIEAYGIFSSIVLLDRYYLTSLRPDLSQNTLYFEYNAWLSSLLQEYLQLTDLNVSNTIITSDNFNNRRNLSLKELLASIMYDLYKRFGLDFAKKMWLSASSTSIPTSNSNQSTVQNFAILASIASSRNLTNLFNNYYKWNLTNATATIINNLRLPNYTF
jgi:hypothetical protein